MSLSARTTKAMRAQIVTRIGKRGPAEAGAPLDGDRLRLRNQLAEHIGQDASVLVVLDLDRRVDAQHDVDVECLAVLAVNGQLRLLHRAYGTEPGDVECFGTVELQRLRVRPFFELQRQNAHADKVRSVDALETLRHDGADAEEFRAFGGPVA